MQEDTKEGVLHMEEWRLLDLETTRDAAMNLAIDEAIFLVRTKQSAPQTLRFWRNVQAAVVGYSQSVEAEVNLELCERENIQVVRRISGGGAVYHDLGNINYTVVLDADYRLIKGFDIAESYRVLCSGMIEGLRNLGITAAFKPLSDIFVVLHHGTLLVDSDLDALTRVLDVPEEKLKDKRITSIKKPVTKLRDELGWEVDKTTLKKALIRGFERAFFIRLTQGKLSSLEEEIAQNLYRDKYSRKEWNFWR